jgi:hypothetical protein
MDDFKNVSDRYRQQMLDLYNRTPKEDYNVNPVSDMPSNIPNAPVEPIPPTPTTIQQPTPMDDCPNDNEDNIPIEEKYPPPTLPPFIYQDTNPPTQTEVLPTPTIEDNSPPEFGYLRVVTTSAEGTIPLWDVSVIVSKTVGDHEEILYTLLTNESGETDTIELEAPNASLSRQPSNGMVKPYAEYNVSAYLHGYFQVVNSKVPIFAGITSIQRVNMIPLPSYTDERKIVTITIPESEPNL